jgi:hypothetical protein
MTEYLEPEDMTRRRTRLPWADKINRQDEEDNWQLAIITLK